MKKVINKILHIYIYVDYYIYQCDSICLYGNDVF